VAVRVPYLQMPLSGARRLQCKRSVGTNPALAASLQPVTTLHPLLHSSQVAIDLPSGRSIVLPVSEATRGAHVVAYVAPMLGCMPTRMRLWRADGNSLLCGDDQATPGQRYHAKLLTEPGGPGHMFRGPA